MCGDPVGEQRMIPSVSHDRSDESPEAKAAWFQSLTFEERMELFCELTELALAARPELRNQKGCITAILQRFAVAQALVARLIAALVPIAQATRAWATGFWNCCYAPNQKHAQPISGRVQVLELP